MTTAMMINEIDMMQQPPTDHNITYVVIGNFPMCRSKRDKENFQRH